VPDCIEMPVWSVSIPSSGCTLCICISNRLCSAIAFREHHLSACYLFLF